MSVYVSFMDGHKGDIVELRAVRSIVNSFMGFTVFNEQKSIQAVFKNYIFLVDQTKNKPSGEPQGEKIAELSGHWDWSNTCWMLNESVTCSHLVIGLLGWAICNKKSDTKLIPKYVNPMAKSQKTQLSYKPNQKDDVWLIFLDIYWRCVISVNSFSHLLSVLFLFLGQMSTLNLKEINHMIVMGSWIVKLVDINQHPSKSININ